MRTDGDRFGLTDYRTHLDLRLSACLIPEHLREGLREYIAVGRPMGQFLTAIVENDLKEAVLRAADPETLVAIGWIVRFLCWHVPAPAWGSPANVKRWLETQPIDPVVTYE